jgi:hypothetical protein
MKKFILLFGCLLTGKVIAGAATLTITPPTTYTDGTTIVDPITFKIYEGPQGVPNKTLIASGLTGTTQTFTGLPSGANACFNGTAVVNGAESDLSNEVCKFINAPYPIPPTLKVAITTVYQVTNVTNGFTLTAVGTVAGSSPCSTTQYVNGYFVVNRSLVKWTGTKKPVVVVAKCN